MLNSSHTIQ